MPGHVLIIDDEASVRMVLKRALEARGYRVAEADDGSSGLDKLKHVEFDLILCDLGLPGLTGSGFYDVVRGAYPYLSDRIVFITGNGVDTQTRTLLEETGSKCLRKPFGLQELYSMAESMVSSERWDRPRQGAHRPNR